MAATLSINNGVLTGSLHVYDSKLNETYNGDYVVIPSIEPQTLETANTIMEEDITISSIPYYEVKNDYGGTTVTIGG